MGQGPPLETRLCEVGVVPQRCFDPTLLIPQNTLPCCLSHSTKYFIAHCHPAKAKGLVWFLFAFSLLLAMSFSLSPLLFVFLSTQPHLPPHSLGVSVFTQCFSLWDCWERKLPVMARNRDYTRDG